MHNLVSNSNKKIYGKYDSGNLFKERKEDLIENNSQKSKFLSKNWHQICYIYDDYDLHDIYYDVKVVGLPENEHTKVNKYYINTSSIIEIQKLSINGKESEYIFNNNYIGQIAKLSLILKGNFDIICFDNYFLARNKKNLTEIEYTWSGVVPNEGKNTLIFLSKIQAKWLFHVSINLDSNNTIIYKILYSFFKNNISIYLKIHFQFFEKYFLLI